MAAGKGGIMAALCALASLALMIPGGLQVDWSCEAIGQSLFPAPAMFLLFTLYYALPFSSSRPTSFQKAKNCKNMFALATAIGLLMPSVIAINNPAAYPPPLVNQPVSRDGMQQRSFSTAHLRFLRLR
jgi:hypothetical protein